MFNTEQFISEVEKCPELYNYRLKEYTNKELRSQTWEEIASKMYENWHELDEHVQNKLGWYCLLLYSVA